MLFLPFGMVNAAHFMLLPQQAGWERALGRASQACLRVLGLLLTALFSFALGLILIDLVGWRWSPKSKLLDGFDTGVVLPGCVTVAALGVVVLSLLNRPGFIRRPRRDPDTSSFPTLSDLDLGLYQVTTGARLLRRLHLSVGLVFIALIGDLARTGREPGANGGPVRVVIAVTVVALIVVVTLMGDPITRGQVPADETLKDRVWGKGSVLPVLLAAGLVVVEIVSLTGAEQLSHWYSQPPARFARLSGLDQIANGLMAFGLIFLFLLGVAVALLARARRRSSPLTAEGSFFRPYAGGLTAFLVAALGVFVAIGFSAAAATTVATTLDLNASDKVEDSGDLQIGTTLMLDRVAYVWGLTVLEILVIAAFLGVGLARAKQTFGPAVRAQFPPGGPRVLPAGSEGRVARAMFVARLKNKVPCIVIVLVVVGVAMSVVQYLETTMLGDVWQHPSASNIWNMALIGSVADHSLPGWLSWADWLSEPRRSGASIVLINLGAWVLVAAAGGIVALSRGALKNSGLRRGINVVWDVFGFWPHSAHPFGPEPYSRWTVIELRNRLRYHLKRPTPTGLVDDGKPAVVVCSHSQGSVIAFAAYLLLDEGERKRVAMLTCGSQLRVIYPRAFPAFFNYAIVSTVFAKLGERWVNLYRTTDPLAGPVLSWNHDAPQPGRLPQDGVIETITAPSAKDHLTTRYGHDWRLPDPIPYDEDVETGAVHAIHGHHDYWLDPTWGVALTFLRDLPRKPSG